MTTNNRDLGSDTQAPFTLRHFLYLTLCPMIVLMFGAGYLTYHMTENIQDHTNTLARNTVTNVLRAQRGAVNLEGLRISLATLVETQDQARARDAYINAWSLLSESALDRHDRTRQSMIQLLQSVRDVWHERQKYDNAREEIRQLWLKQYSDMLNAFAAVHPFRYGQLPPLTFSSMRTDYRNYDLKVHGRQAAEFDHMYEMICKREDSAPVEQRAAVGALCSRIADNSRKLQNAVTELPKIRASFEAEIARMEQQTIALRSEYSTIETTALLDDIRHINDITNPAVPVIVTLLAVFAMMVGIIFLGFYTVLRPFMSISQQMNRFIETGVMPERPKSRIREINEGISWLMKFCEITKKERVEKRLIETQYSNLLTESALDPLTGVANRKSLQDFIKHNTMTRARTGLMMIDIDHFKAINDTRGHPFGDQILEALGHQLKSHIAANDLIYRYGGEEFCVVMPDITPETLVAAAHRLLHKVHAISRQDASIHPSAVKKDPLTISIGLSSVTSFDGEKSLLTLLREADTALYQAKNSGRDRACVYNPTEPHMTYTGVADDLPESAPTDPEAKA